MTRWLKAMRVPFLSASVILVLVGGAVSFYSTGTFDVFYFALTLLGIATIHIGANMVNDYFDYKSGTDNINKELTPFSGGSRAIQEGAVSPETMYKGSILFFGIGAVIGLYLAYARGWPVLALGLFGVITSYLYTQNRVNLAGRGVGEIVLGLDFGPLTTIGTYFVLTMSYDIGDYVAPVVAGIVMGLLISSILWINQFPDCEADRKSNKKNWVVRIGKEKASKVYGALMMSTYIIVAVAAVLDIFPLWTILMFLTTPLAYKAIKIARTYHSDTKKLIPANASTIQITTLNGILLCIAFILGQFIKLI
jgi:1,4-dihydroxy-2-naphthoate octaprenyltransferase